MPTTRSSTASKPKSGDTSLKDAKPSFSDVNKTSKSGSTSGSTSAATLDKASTSENAKFTSSEMDMSMLIKIFRTEMNSLLDQRLQANSSTATNVSLPLFQWYLCPSVTSYARMQVCGP